MANGRKNDSFGQNDYLRLPDGGMCEGQRVLSCTASSDSPVCWAPYSEMGATSLPERDERRDRSGDNESTLKSCTEHNFTLHVAKGTDLGLT